MAGGYAALIRRRGRGFDCGQVRIAKESRMGALRGHQRPDRSWRRYSLTLKHNSFILRCCPPTMMFCQPQKTDRQLFCLPTYVPEGWGGLR